MVLNFDLPPPPPPTIFFFLLRHPRPHLSPEIAPRTTTALPGAGVDEPKLVRDARADALGNRQVVGDDRCRHVPARGVENHLDRGCARIRRPGDAAVAALGHGGVGGVSFGVGDGDHGGVVDDEVAPCFLEGGHEVLGWRCCVGGEVGRDVAAVVGRRDGILVFPALSVSGECFRQPVGWAGERGFAIDVEQALLLACGELGLVQCRGSTITKRVESRN